MIIVKIYGGLGNQMFQYATAKRLAMKHDVELRLYPSFSSDHKRSFMLQYFDIHEPIATEDDVDQLILSHRKFKGLSHKVLRRIEKWKPYYKRRHYTYRAWSNDHGILKASSHVFLEGYWANELFFKDIRKEILQRFQIREEFHIPAFDQIKKNIDGTETVSVHIRRGDYADNRKHYDFFGLLPQDYYQRAIDYFLKKHQGVKFYIFADDIDYVKNNLKFDAEIIFVDDSSLSDFHELKLMSYCRHNIIANSTFSWWAAWLNENPDKTVIAPKIWYRNKEAQSYYEKYSFVPDTWIKL